MENNIENNEPLLRLSCIITSVLKQWRLIIIVVCLCASLFDVIKTITYKPVYGANVIVAVLDGDGKGLDGDSTVKGNETIRYLFNSSYMRNLVNKELDQAYFNGSINTIVTANTNMVTINVTSSTQKDAYFQLDKLIEIYREISVRQSFGYYINVIEDITFTNQPMNYNSHRSNYKTGFILGLVGIVGLLGAMSYFKDNVKTPSEVNDKVDARLFAKIPREFKRNQRFSFFNNKKSAILVSHFQTGFGYVEAMNKLASKIENEHIGHKFKTFLITSSLENEGKSSVAVNLAISLAKNKHKVLLVDADMRKPALHKIFEYTPDKTLVEILSDDEAWKKCVVHLDRENVDVIFSTPSNESQELLSEKFQGFIRKAKRSYDYVIIDSAPSRYIHDTAMISSLCDATLLVVQQNTTACKIINDTIYQLVNNGANVIGAIFNGSVYDITRVRSSYGYRYGYYRYHRKGGSNNEE